MQFRIPSQNLKTKKRISFFISWSHFYKSPWNSLRKKIVKSELWNSTLRKKSLNRRQWIAFWFFAGKGPSPTLQQQVLPATSIDSASPPPEPEDITPPPGPWGDKVLIENAAVHVDMGKVVGVLRATHKLEDEVNHQENGKNYFDLYKSQEIQVLKVSSFMYYQAPMYCRC